MSKWYKKEDSKEWVEMGPEEKEFYGLSESKNNVTVIKNTIYAKSEKKPNKNIIVICGIHYFIIEYSDIIGTSEGGTEIKCVELVEIDIDKFKKSEKFIDFYLENNECTEFIYEEFLINEATFWRDKLKIMSESLKIQTFLEENNFSILDIRKLQNIFLETNGLFLRIWFSSKTENFSYMKKFEDEVEEKMYQVLRFC